MKRQKADETAGFAEKGADDTAQAQFRRLVGVAPSRFRAVVRHEEMP